MKYFIFNKSIDYERGYMENCCWNGNALTLLEGSREGAMISRVLDSREKWTVWHRFTRRGDDPFGASVRILVFAGEKRSILWDGKEWSLDEMIQSGSISFQDKLKIFAPCLQAEMN
ncbi:MAG: hypothetical protein RR590_01615, partial [Hungatella sp.]